MVEIQIATLSSFVWGPFRYPTAHCAEVWGTVVPGAKGPGLRDGKKTKLGVARPFFRNRTQNGACRFFSGFTLNSEVKWLCF